MSAARSYPPRMPDRSRRGRSAQRQPRSADEPVAGEGPRPVPSAKASPASDVELEASLEAEGAHPAFALDGLAIAGITRRRAGWIAAAAFTLWIVLVFARQVGDATAKSSDLERRRADNASLQADVQQLQDELVLIQKQAYIVQQGHAFRLGGPQDHPFSLSPDAPPLSSTAPGSAAVRLGATQQQQSPLESWLSTLFGPVH